jgi:hypothetical protein
MRQPIGGEGYTVDKHLGVFTVRTRAEKYLVSLVEKKPWFNELIRAEIHKPHYGAGEWELKTVDDNYPTVYRILPVVHGLDPV